MLYSSWELTLDEISRIHLHPPRPLCAELELVGRYSRVFAQLLRHVSGEGMNALLPIAIPRSIVFLLACSTGIAASPLIWPCSSRSCVLRMDTVPRWSGEELTEEQRC